VSIDVTRWAAGNFFSITCSEIIGTTASKLLANSGPRLRPRLVAPRWIAPCARLFNSQLTLLLVLEYNSFALAVYSPSSALITMSQALGTDPVIKEGPERSHTAEIRRCKSTDRSKICGQGSDLPMPRRPGTCPARSLRIMPATPDPCPRFDALVLPCVCVPAPAPRSQEPRKARRLLFPKAVSSKKSRKLRLSPTTAARFRWQ
jgi:hypothetical protein